MTLKAGFKQCNTDPCLLYILNGLGTVIVIFYVDDTLEIGDKPVFMDNTNTSINHMRLNQWVNQRTS